jgi:HEAT repeat protein
MKKNIVVEVPVSSREFIDLPAPCTYCGQQIEPGAKEREIDVFYTLKHWAPGKKFDTIQLWDIKDNNGVVQTGHVIVRAPYCAQHVKGVGLFDTTLLLSIAVMLIAAVFNIVWLWSFMDNWVETLILIGGSLFLGFWIGVGIAWVINTLIALQKPEFRDYPKVGLGHWGLEVNNVRVDTGKYQVGPVKYFLPLGFLNVESAKRFLVAYPDAKVIKEAKSTQYHQPLNDEEEIEILTDESEKVKTASGDPKVEITELIEQLKSNSSTARHSASARLRNLGAPAVIPLIEELQHGALESQRSAAGILGKIGDPRAVQPLVDVSVSYSPKALRAVCDTALLAIGEPALDRIIFALQESIKGNNTQFSEAADLLGRMGNPRAVKPLEEAYETHHWDSYTIQALGSIDGDEATRVLIKILADEKSRSVAARWLEKRGEAAVPALTAALQSDNADIRKQAAKLLVKLGASEPEQTSAKSSKPKTQMQKKSKKITTLPGTYPQWEKVKTDPASLPKRMLSELQKAMVFIVCEDGVEQAAVIARADRSEFHSVVTDSTPMRLHIDFFTGRGGALFGIYPLVMDDPTDPAFKETWMNPYDDLPEFGTIDPLSAEQRKRLQLLLSQQYVWMIFINHNNQYLWVRKVAYTSQQLKVFQEYSKKLDQYTGRTIEKTQYFNLLQEYMNAVSTETLQRDFVQLFKQR